MLKEDIISVNLDKEQMTIFSLAGHNFKLHYDFLVSIATPLQGFPPFTGAGFVQLRLRICNPSPHVFEQEAHSDHADQLPFTKDDRQ